MCVSLFSVSALCVMAFWFFDSKNQHCGKEYLMLREVNWRLSVCTLTVFHVFGL